MKQEEVQPDRRRVSVAWLLVSVLSLVLLLVLAAFAGGLIRVQLFPLPIL